MSRAIRAASRPRRAARDRHSGDELLGTHIAVLGPRVARAAICAASRPEEPCRASASSISARRRENAWSTRAGTPSNLRRRPSPPGAIARRGCERARDGARLGRESRRFAHARRRAARRAPTSWPSDRLDEVGDQDVRVQLRIPRATGPMQEGGGGQPVAARSSSVRRRPAGRPRRATARSSRTQSIDGSLVRVADRGLDVLGSPIAEEHADALGRGEGDVEARDRAAAPELHRRSPDRLPARIAVELVAGHDARGVASEGAPRPSQTAGRLAPADVVVLSARRQRGAPGSGAARPGRGSSWACPALSLPTETIGYPSR